MATGDLDLRNRLQGCYVTLPTMFHDDAELSVDLDAMRGHVRFLIDGGITTGTGVLLAGVYAALSGGPGVPLGRAAAARGRTDAEAR